MADCHPNGRPILDFPKYITRNDEPFYERIFENSNLGNLLQALSIQFLIKQEPRMGWAKRGACSEEKLLLPYPCETVASHMWGVSAIIAAVSRDAQFQKEIPVFDRQKATDMANLHDQPEIITRDITPQDNIPEEVKHADELKAIHKIMSYHSEPVAEALLNIYNIYEKRQCIESKFVKDCDKLDFLLTAFILERQGFTCIDIFYSNIIDKQFHTQIADQLAKLLFKTRNDLHDNGLLFVKNKQQ